MNLHLDVVAYEMIKDSIASSDMAINQVYIMRGFVRTGFYAHCYRMLMLMHESSLLFCCE